MAFLSLSLAAWGTIAGIALGIGGAASSLTTGIVGGVQAQQQADQQAAIAEMNAINQKRQYDYQAEVAKNEAFMLQQQAQQTQQEALINEQAERKQTKRLMATQEATTAGAGLEMAGSPLEVLGLTSMEGEKRALNIRRQGEIGAQEKIFNANKALSNVEMYNQMGNMAVDIGAMQSSAYQAAGANRVTNSIMSGIGGTMSGLSSAASAIPMKGINTWDNGSTGVSSSTVSNNFSSQVMNTMTNPYSSNLPTANHNNYSGYL